MPKLHPETQQLIQDGALDESRVCSIISRHLPEALRFRLAAANLTLADLLNGRFKASDQILTFMRDINAEVGFEFFQTKAVLDLMGIGNEVRKRFPGGVKWE